MSTIGGRRPRIYAREGNRDRRAVDRVERALIEGERERDRPERQRDHKGTDRIAEMADRERRVHARSIALGLPQDARCEQVFELLELGYGTDGYEHVADLEGGIGARRDIEAPVRPPNGDDESPCRVAHT